MAPRRSQRAWLLAVLAIPLRRAQRGVDDQRPARPPRPRRVRLRPRGGDPFPPGQCPKTEILWTAPGYLETIGIALLRGRDLGWSDVKTSQHVILVNEAFVRRFIPQGEPLGRRVSEILGPGNDPWEIAGVIGDVRTKGLDKAPSPLVMVPLQQYQVATLRVAVRAAAGDPMLLLAPLRSEVQALDKDLTLSLPQPLSRIVAESVGERRFRMTLLSIFALVALVLAALAGERFR